MNRDLFQIFSRMLDRIPVAGLLRVIWLEQRLLEEDLTSQRITQSEDTESVLAFCRFVKQLGQEGESFHANIPATHAAYYRSVLFRLIKAGKLPVDSAKKFEIAVDTVWEDSLSV